MYLAQVPEADDLLVRDPLALVIAMLLDQQIPLERAFLGPYEITRRLGRALDPAEIAAMDPDELAGVFSERPAIHRFPIAMAKRVQALCSLVASEYGGDAEQIWAGAADGADALKRIGALPGFGKVKAQIFLALLGKQYGLTVKGWQKASGQFGEKGSYKSVADIVDPDSLAKVRSFKQQMKAAAKAAAASD